MPTDQSHLLQSSVLRVTELQTQCTDLFTQNHSKNEKQVVVKIVPFLIINYGIVLSSVLFGYGTIICINKIDICNSRFIQMKFKKQTLFSKF